MFFLCFGFIVGDGDLSDCFGYWVVVFFCVFDELVFVFLFYGWKV